MSIGSGGAMPGVPRPGSPQGSQEVQGGQPSSKAAKVFLVGMPGTGKSSVAPLLAPRLGWGYVDSDAQIEKVSGLSIPGFFARHGEQAFRIQEARCIKWVSGLSDPLIVAVGGGAVLDLENRILMKENGIIIWFRAALDTLVARLSSQVATRPLIGEGDIRSNLKNLEAVRAPLYQEIATLTIDVDDGDIDKVTDRVLRALGRVGKWQGASGR